MKRLKVFGEVLQMRLPSSAETAVTDGFIGLKQKSQDRNRLSESEAE